MKKYSLLLLFLISNLTAFAEEAKLERFPIEAIKPLQDSDKTKLYAVFLFGDGIGLNSCTIGHIQMSMLDIHKHLDKNLVKLVPVFMLRDSIEAAVYASNFPKIVNDKVYYTYNAIFPAYCDRNNLDYNTLLFVQNDGEVIDKYTFREYMNEKADYDKLSLKISDIVVESYKKEDEINKNLSIGVDTKPATVISSVKVIESADTALARAWHWKKKGDTLYGVDELTKDLYSLDMKTGKLFKYNELPVEFATYFQDKNNTDSAYTSAWKAYIEKYNHRRKNRNSIYVRDNILTNVMDINDTAIICGGVIAKQSDAPVACGSHFPDIPNVIISINRNTQKPTVFTFPVKNDLMGLANPLKNNEILMSYDPYPIDSTSPVASILYRNGSQYEINNTVKYQDLGLSSKYYSMIYTAINKKNVFGVWRVDEDKSNLDFRVYDISTKKVNKYSIPIAEKLLDYDNYSFKCIDCTDDLSSLSVLYSHKTLQRSVIMNYNLKTKESKYYTLELPAECVWADFASSNNSEATLLVKYAQGVRWQIETIRY